MPLSNNNPSSTNHAEILKIMEAWSNAFSEETPDTLLTLYADDAVLWGTFSVKRRNNPAEIHDYFKTVFTKTRQRVAFDQPYIRIYDDIAISSGTYTFSWRRGAKKESINARYSFTYQKRNGQWLIVDHHSSILPDPGVLTEVLNSDTLGH